MSRMLQIDTRYGHLFFYFTYFKPTKPEDKTQLLKGLRK